MSTNHEFHLMQLSDSFFPSGMFSMSSGLEPLILDKKITDWTQVLNFITEQIEFQIYPCDCTVLSIAFSGAKNNDIKTVIDIDKKYHSIKLPKEARISSVRSGKQVLNCIIHMIEKNDFLNEFNKTIKSNETPGTYPVILAISAYYLKIPLGSITRMMLYSFCSSIVSAAIRLGIIQHLDAQKILTLLSEPINNFVSLNNVNDLHDIWQFTPLTEIYQMNHEKNETRMFIT